MKIVYKGEEVEVDDSEVLKSVSEEYQSQIATLTQQVEEEKQKAQCREDQMRKDFAKQIRVIMQTGRIEDTDVDEMSEEEKEEEDIRARIERIKRGIM